MEGMAVMREEDLSLLPQIQMAAEHRSVIRSLLRSLSRPSSWHTSVQRAAMAQNCAGLSQVLWRKSFWKLSLQIMTNLGSNWLWWHQ